MGCCRVEHNLAEVVPVARAKNEPNFTKQTTHPKKYRRKYTSCISTTPTIKTRLEAAFQIMTDVAAVVAAAAGNRGIGFQGKLVSFYLYFGACHVFVFPIALVLNR